MFAEPYRREQVIFEDGVVRIVVTTTVISSTAASTNYRDADPVVTLRADASAPEPFEDPRRLRRPLLPNLDRRGAWGLNWVDQIFVEQRRTLLRARRENAPLRALRLRRGRACSSDGAYRVSFY